MSSSPALRAKIEPALLKQALQGDPSAQYRFLVELAHQPAPVSPGADALGPDRRNQVVANLQTTAEVSQADLLTFLQAQQAEGRVQEIHPFWIVNAIAVTADAQALLAISAQPEVRIIREDSWRRWVDPPSVAQGQVLSGNEDSEWNISRVRADLAWSALGLDGSGVTVAIMDTGVDWQHPALQTQYRGYKPGGLAIHQGNWFCTTDEGYLYPVDGNGHGTHVAGTAVGSRDTSGQAIGVAPGARWVAVKTMNDQGYAYDSWIHAAFEWILAPDGDPAIAPDIVNGSWGSPNGQDETFRPDLQALRAAGIVPVFAAGNEGPDRSSLRSPGSYPEAVAVGATDDLGNVTSFSSRGPSTWGEVKPEVVAPGVQIRSSLPGGTYGMKNGTSMAAPHVTGLVALMLQADPTLSVDDVEGVLTSTALPLADQVPSNDSGWGQVDAYRAAAVALQAGYIAGQVTRYPDLQPLSIAHLTARDDLGEQQATVQVDTAGHYVLALPPGRYHMETQAFGYEPYTVNDVLVQTAQTITLDIQLSPSPAGVLWGEVRNAETMGPVSALIAVDATPASATSDPQTGQYSMVLPAGSYTIHTSQNGYRRSTVEEVEIVAEEATRLDSSLTPAPTLLLVDSGRWYYGSQASYFQWALDDNNYVYDTWEVRNRETDIPGEVDLAPYDVTIWSSPLDAPGLIGAGDTISSYLSLGGDLLLTGQDVGFWDDGLSGLYYHPYYRQWLKARAVTDNAGRDSVTGLPGDILAGLSLPMNGPDSAADQVSPDAIAVDDPRGAAIIGQYDGDGDAALRASGCQSYQALYLAAGLEGLGDRASRAEVMDRALTWLNTPHAAVDVRLEPIHQDQVWLEARSITYTVELQNTGQSTDRFALELSPSAWPVVVWDGTFTQPITQSMVLGSCQTQTLGLKVTVPADVTWNVTDVVTLTARSSVEPGRLAQTVFQSKAPAPILLVDDDRWYDMEGRYQAALQASGLSYDLWTTRQSPLSDVAPTLQHLTRYPLVIWFTGYDWYRTLTSTDENRLATYLDGGGRLLLSSQDYLHSSGFSGFAREYLGVAGYTEGLSVTQVTGTVGSPIGHGLGPYELMYPFRNWSDALRAEPGAQVGFWGQQGQPAALTLEQMPWRTAFFAFPLESLQAKNMATVLGRAVEWLSPLGDSSLAVDRRVAAQGDPLSYTVLIRNTGPTLLSSVILSNTVPLRTSYVPGSLTGPAQHDSATDRFVWSGILASGETISVSYKLQLESPLPSGTTVENVIHLTDDSGLAVERVAITWVDSPDLSASTKTVNVGISPPGHVITYTLILRNAGLRAAQAHLIDPTPLYTAQMPGSAWASSGLLTSTREALFWSGSISIGQPITISIPVVISPTLSRRYVLNRAILTDGWGAGLPLEANTWAATQLFLPLVLKQP